MLLSRIGKQQVEETTTGRDHPRPCIGSNGSVSTILVYEGRTCMCTKVCISHEKRSIQDDFYFSDGTPTRHKGNQYYNNQYQR